MEVAAKTSQTSRPAAAQRFPSSRRKVGHFSKAEHVVVRIGGRGIAEFRSNPGQDSKISPRSSHPSPQRCCIHSDFFISRFTHLTCCDRVAPLKMTEPYRWWREKMLIFNHRASQRLITRNHISIGTHIYEFHKCVILCFFLL